MALAVDVDVLTGEIHVRSHLRDAFKKREPENRESNISTYHSFLDLFARFNLHGNDSEHVHRITPASASSRA